MCSLSLLDLYGFESLETNSLEQLCINYVAEKLQQNFIRFFFKVSDSRSWIFSYRVGV